MQLIGLDVWIAVAGTMLGVLALYQQSHTPGRVLGLNWLGKVSLIIILAAGALTLRALSLRRIDVLKEREKTLQVQIKLERASLTIEQLGSRLQVALDRNSKLSANIEAMRQDLIAPRTATAQGILVPEYIGAPLGDQRWHNNTIMLEGRTDPVSKNIFFVFERQATGAFEPGPLGRERKVAAISLVNVRPSDMSAPTFRLQWADVVSPRSFTEVIRGGREPESTSAFAHGDTVVVPPTKASNIRYWVSLDDVDFKWHQFLKRNTDAAIRISVE